MSYNWTSAETPQGRERLKELAGNGTKTVIARMYIPHDQRHDVSEWPIRDVIRYEADLQFEEPLEFLDPEPPKPISYTRDEMWESYMLGWKGRGNLFSTEADAMWEHWLGSLPKPAPLSIDEMRRYCLDYFEGLGLAIGQRFLPAKSIRLSHYTIDGVARWHFHQVSPFHERCGDDTVVLYYAMIHAIRNRLIP